MGQKDRPNYWKNAALLTGSDVVLRLAGLGLRIGLANALGGEGMGLYQLVLAVYGLFVTLATAGISVAATRLLTEELSRDAASARGMLRRLLALGAGLGVLAMVAQAGLAGLAAKWWLGDVRAAGALRLSALGLPWMAVSAVLRGFFLARRRVGPNVASQLAEQTVRIGAVAAALYATPGRDAGERCTLVLGATALSEAVSCTLMALFCRGEARRCFGGKRAQTPPEASRRLWDILWPVEGGRVLASALHTAENMLVPACLAVYLTGAGGRAAALEQYGVLKGMALPLLTFPFGLLGSLAVLLMPEITQAHVLGQTARLNALLDRMLRLTGFFSALAAALFWCWGPDAAGLLYGSAEAGFYLQVLAPVLPLLYLESMVDGAMKGVGSRKPPSATACGTPCCGWRGGGAAAPVRHAGLSGRDAAVHPVHLHGQHRAAAAFQRDAPRLPAVAGRSGAGRGTGRGGGHRAAAGAGAASCGGVLAPAGGIGRGRMCHGGGVFAGGMAAGAGGGAGEDAGDDLELPPLCSGNRSGNKIFRFATLENLRIFQSCFFTGGAVPGSCICCCWPAANAQRE